MTKITLFFVSFMFAYSLLGQSFQADMSKTLKIHEDSETPEEQYKGLEKMEFLVNKYPDEWLPNFWAAYQCTQLAMLKSRGNYLEQLDQHELLNRSEKYLNRANELAKYEMTDVLDADLHALRSLIYRFKYSYSKNKEKDIRFKELEEKEREMAVVLNSESPVVMVFAAIDLMRKEKATYAEKLGAVQLMKMAQEKFSQYPTRALTTNFNQEWLPFWLPRAEEKMKNIGKDEHDNK